MKIQSCFPIHSVQEQILLHNKLKKSTYFHSRWLTYPDIYVHFVHGDFVIRKSQRRFSAMSIDQAHDQNSTLVKDESGAIGLTGNLAAFLRWMSQFLRQQGLLQNLNNMGRHSLKMQKCSSTFDCPPIQPPLVVY